MAPEGNRQPGRVAPLGRERVAELRRVVRLLAGSSPELIRELFAVIDRRTAAAGTWRFVMLGPIEDEAVMLWIIDNAKRPFVSLRLWASFRTNLHSGTNEILMPRKLMMERARASSAHVSEALAELLAIGAVERRRDDGRVRWFLSAMVATHLTGAARDAVQQASPPLLAAIEAGAPAP